MALFDLMLLLLLANAVHAMTGHYISVPGGLIVVSTLLMVNMMFTFLFSCSLIMQTVQKETPPTLIQRSISMKKNTQKEYIARRESHHVLKNEELISAMDRIMISDFL
jgi:uncharacterized membrane protein YcaP (DUF421 family)